LRENIVKKFLKSAAIATTRRLGYELTPEWKVDQRPLVRHLRALFASYEIDCIFDVGGNLGQFHDLLRVDIGFKSTILTFEPVSAYIDHLRKKARSDPHWYIFPYALGASNCEAKINVTKSPGLNSFLDPRSDVVKDFWSSDSISGVENVQIRTLDTTLPQVSSKHQFSRPYLKLDTQGFDLEVLRGAAVSLHSMIALQTEASVLPIYEAMPTYEETFRYLRAAGFDLSGMFPVTLDDSMRLLEFDCVAVNKRFIK
jgi:FkbM family methyltransferase